MQPLITIGIASYNYENYIEKALSAIKRQKYKNYEVLISDDCSTDNSVKVIKQFMESNPEMKIQLMVSTENKGLVENKNLLIENCHGEYLMLCDADDWMADNCLEKVAEILCQEKPDRVIMAFFDIDETGKIIQIQDIPENQTKWGWNAHHGSVYKTDIIRKHNVRIKDEPDDVYFTIEYTKYCRKVSSIKEPLYYWLVHLDSEGRKQKDDFSREYLKYIQELRFVGETIEYLKQSREYTDRDVEELRLVFLKLYYFNIFFVLQRLPLKKKLHFYKDFHDVMVKIDSRYLENDFLRVKEPSILRNYALKSIRLFVKAEKLKLMKLVLLSYHFVSKIMYFDQ